MNDSRHEHTYFPLLSNFLIELRGQVVPTQVFPKYNPLQIQQFSEALKLALQVQVVIPLVSTTATECLGQESIQYPLNLTEQEIHSSLIKSNPSAQTQVDPPSAVGYETELGGQA